jgi:hypothetical protein
MTYNSSDETYQSGICPYKPNIAGNTSLSNDNFMLKLSISTKYELNATMCGHLNREGLLCAKCKPNYGTALYSKTFQCMSCNSKAVWMWALYVFLETAPLTALYFSIVIFNVRATSPPFTAFLFHHQFLSFLNTLSVYSVRIGNCANQTLLKLTLTVMDIWNMDALRHLLPFFCVSSSLSNFQVQAIRLTFTLHPLILVIASFLLIDLHARNCRVVVVLWKPFHRCFAQFRRTWDPKASNITAFSTFVSLVMFKLILVGFYTLYPTHIWKHGHGMEKKLYIDPYVDSRQLTDLPWWPLIGTLLLITLLGLFLPMLLLCLYPCKLCRRWMLCNGHHRCQILRLFLETYQGHYKDGTNGTHDYRAVASLAFIVRLLAAASLFPANSRISIGPSSAMIYVLVTLSLLYSIVRPCKKNYMNNLESILYCFTALTLLFINLKINPRISKVGMHPVIINTFLVVQLLPSTALLLKVVHKAYVVCIPKWLKWNKFAGTGQSQLEEFPDRIVHPSEYSSLLD